MPADIPVTIPVLLPIVAVEGAVLDQTPPDMESLSVTVAPTHTFGLPVIAGVAIIRLTVSGDVTEVGQPYILVTVYVIVVTPDEIPVEIPVDKPIVATAGVLLVQRPPGVASVSVMVVPVHCPVGPLIALTTGTGLTVIILKAVLVPHALLTM